MQFNDDSAYIITINRPQYYDKLVGLKSSPNARLIVRFTTLIILVMVIQPFLETLMLAIINPNQSS